MALLFALFLAAHLPSPCTGSQLAGTFAAVPGSAGAGNIVYALTVRNRSQHECFVTGIPGVTLLDKHGHKLPTHTRAEFPGALTAVIVRLVPGARAQATARFSPDVPGVGEKTLGPCEPTSFTLLVKPNGGGILKVPLKPPTPVCEHGGMSWRVFTALR